jgi:hypothetical protein
MIKALIIKEISNVKNLSDVITRKVFATNLSIDTQNEIIRLDYTVQNYKNGEIFNQIKEQRDCLTATNLSRIYVDENFKITTDTSKREMGLFDYLIFILNNGANIIDVAKNYIAQNDANGRFDIY